MADTEGVYLMGCNCAKTRQSQWRYTPIDRLTGSYLITDTSGCVSYRTPLEARTAALSAGFVNPGVKRVSP